MGQARHSKQACRCDVTQHRIRSGVNRHTPDQIIRKIAEGNKLLASGQELDAVCRNLEVAESTWSNGPHGWPSQ
jgi:hypothetical protein